MLTIVIMTRDRPQFLKECLSSVIQAKDNCKYNVQVIVSDNSRYMSNETENCCKSFNVTYKRQDGKKSFPEHFNLLKKYIQSKYFMVLHDDDRIYRHYLENAIEYMEKNSIQAYCGNSKIINKGSYTRDSFFQIQKYKYIKGDKLLRDYLLSKSTAQLSLYVFSSLHKDLAFSNNSIYSDVNLLVDSAFVGRMVWDRKLSGEWHCHGENISSMPFYSQRRSLIKEMQTKYDALLVNKLGMHYRLFHRFINIINNRDYSIFRRKRLLRLFLFRLSGIGLLQFFINRAVLKLVRFL